MLIDISPLKKHRDFRLLFIGQLISFLGSMVSYMAVPYQVFLLTKSNALVGALGIAQLIPVLIFGLLGGAYADRINRRQLMLTCESAMAPISSYSHADAHRYVWLGRSKFARSVSYCTVFTVKPLLESAVR